MGLYDDLLEENRRSAPAPDAGGRGLYGDLLPQEPVPLPQPRPTDAEQPSMARQIYRAIGGWEPGAEPARLPSFDTSKPAPSERLSETIGRWPTLGLQLFPPTGAVLGGLDMQYHMNRDELGSAMLAGAPAGMGSGAKVLKDVAKAGFEAPSSKELLKIGGSEIEQYRNLPKTYVSTDIEALANSMKSSIGGKAAHPITHEAVDDLLAKAKNSPFVTPQMIDDFRVATSEASKKGEAGAMKARDLLYAHLEKTGDPADQLLMSGIKNYAGGKRGEIVDTILRKGAGYGNEGQRLDAAARSLVDNSAKRLRGFTDAEVEALDKARQEGSKLFSAGNVVSGRTLGQVGSLGVPGALGYGAFAMGTGPVGVGAATLAAPAAGAYLRSGGTALRRGALEDVGSLVRGRSPAGEAARAAYETGPVATQGGRNAIARALLSQGPQNVDQGQANWLLDRTVNPFIYGGM